MRIGKGVLVALVIVAQVLAGQAVAPAQTYTAEVKDISSRDYYPAVYPLIENAKKSIYMNMYVIVPGPSTSFDSAQDKSLRAGQTHPVNRLLDALKRAAKRGVKVKICLNTKATYRYSPGEIPEKPWIDELIKSGVEIVFADPAKSLHAKSIVIDEEIVVEGSVNWSEASFDYNFESATLIYSKELALEKIKRIEQVEVYADAQGKQKSLFAYPAPGKLRLPRAFIQDKRFLWKMNAKRAERAIKLYLLIQYVYQSYPEEERKDGITLDVDLCAPYIGISPEWTRENTRRQVISVLRSLKSEYPLIELRLHHSKPAWLKPLDLGQEKLVIDSQSLGPEDLKTLSRKEIVEMLTTCATK